MTVAETTDTNSEDFDDVSFLFFFYSEKNLTLNLLSIFFLIYLNFFYVIYRNLMRHLLKDYGV